MLLIMYFFGIISSILHENGGEKMNLKVKKSLLGVLAFSGLVAGQQMSILANTQENESVMTIIDNNLKRVKYNIPEYWNQRERKVVYLTFDDGPSVRTSKILDILKEHDVQGTFFFVGTQISGKESIVEKVDREGHYVGMHTISHSVNELYNDETPDNLSNELIQMQDMIEEITGKRPILFRPPYGSMPHMNKEAIIDSLIDNGFKSWDWTVDTYDWSASSVAEVMGYVERTAGSKNEVVLMHEKEMTISALPQIIQYYKDNGYEFRVYDEALHTPVNFMKNDEL